jgi:hypothetical protein
MDECPATAVIFPPLQRMDPDHDLLAPGTDVQSGQPLRSYYGVVIEVSSSQSGGKEGSTMGFGYGFGYGYGCGYPVGFGYTTVGVILVLFILLVIVSRAWGI